MDIDDISLHELRKMNDCEGLVLQGCGGDLQEWVNGINDMLTEAEYCRAAVSLKKHSLLKTGTLPVCCFHLMTFSLMSESLQYGGSERGRISEAHGCRTMWRTRWEDIFRSSRKPKILKWR